MSNPQKKMKKMKKFILSLGLIAMAFSLTNCSQEYDFATVEQNNFEIYAAAYHKRWREHTLGSW